MMKDCISLIELFEWKEIAYYKNYETFFLEIIQYGHDIRNC